MNSPPHAAPPSVLLVTLWYGGGNNGVGVVAETLTQGLLTAGGKCTVLHLAPDGVLASRERGTKGETILRFCVRSEPRGGSLVSWVGYHLRAWLAERRLRALVREYGIEVIHFHFNAPEYEVLQRIAARLGLTMVITFHGADLTVNMQKPDTAPVTRTIVDAAGAVTVVSSDFRSTALKFFPEAADKTVVLHNCVPESMLEAARVTPVLPAEERTVDVFFIGNLIPRKGVDVLLRAMDRVRQDFPEARCVIVGDGTERSALESLARELGLEKNVQFLGVQSRAELPNWLAQAKVMAVPSRAEPFGVVLAEGQMFSVPLVASRVGGIPEVIAEGETGLLVPPEDPSALGDAIVSLLRDPERRSQMSAAGRIRAERYFAPQAMAQAYVAMYRTAIQRSRDSQNGSGGRFTHRNDGEERSRARSGALA